MEGRVTRFPAFLSSFLPLISPSLPSFVRSNSPFVYLPLNSFWSPFIIFHTSPFPSVAAAHSRTHLRTGTCWLRGSNLALDEIKITCKVAHPCAEDLLNHDKCGSAEEQPVVKPFSALTRFWKHRDICSFFYI